jgi:hypothetical protein
MKRLILAGLVVAFAFSAWAEEPGIIPGSRMAGVALGSARSEVLKALGRPNRTSQNGSLTRDSWLHGRSLVLWSRRGRIVQVTTTSPTLKTPEGLSRSSAWADVAAAHATLTRSVYTTRSLGGGGSICYYDDVSRGIAFEFTENLGPRSSTNRFSIYAIHVHVPGSQVIPERDEVPAHPSQPCPDTGGI